MKNITVHAHAGDCFSDVAQKAKDTATKTLNAEFDFNGIIVVVSQETDLDNLYRDYSNAFRMEWKTVGPDCAEEYSEEVQKELNERTLKANEESAKRRLAYEAEEKRKKDEANEKLKDIVFEFASKKAKADWEQGLENNQDSYGNACYTYAERWGKLMQWEMAQRNLSKIDAVGMIAFANETSNEADVEGITGFMYGAAVSILANTWKYGEELRKWHNKDYGHEGDGVVNPAVITIKG